MKNSSQTQQGAAVKENPNPNQPTNPAPDSSAGKSTSTSSPSQKRQRPSSKKPLDKIRADHATGGGEGAKDDKKKTRKPRKSTKKIYTPQDALNLCQLPFVLGQSITGFAWEMPENLKGLIGMSGAEVMNEFGIEIFHKYVMLGVFLASYGSCAWMWGKAYMVALKTQADRIKQEKLDADRVDGFKPVGTAAAADTNKE